MQIPILSGIYTDEGPDFRTSYPVNFVPVPKETGLNKGYLRPADGIVSLGTGPGVDRGGINWNGECYRVMGNSLVKITSNGSVITLGTLNVSWEGNAIFDYSFDQLAIAFGGKLFYWDGSDITEVTDTDLGNVVDMKWVDGYFMTTDGTSLVVTELSDSTSVNPLKYGSSEADPDKIKALLKLRNEIYALNRNTIEVFDNVGGDFFPFQRIEGAQIQKGCIGTMACCVYMDAIAFLGGGRNEPVSVYIGMNANATKIATREIETLLAGYSESDLVGAQLEARPDKANQFLYVHLSDRTLVYDAAASAVLGSPIWHVLTTATSGFSQYRARNMVWCYGKWIVGDPQTEAFGYFSDTTSEHWDETVRWEFGTVVLYGEGRGAIVHDLELVALTGRINLADDPTINTSYSLDGETWSVPKSISAGKRGDRSKRLLWMGQGPLRNWRIQRFQGDSNARISIARLEARVEPLAV